MYSVKTDPTPSPSLPGAPPRSSRADPSQPKDGFSALIDSNMAADPVGISAPQPTQDPTAAKRPALTSPTPMDGPPPLAPNAGGESPVNPTSTTPAVAISEPVATTVMAQASPSTLVPADGEDAGSLKTTRKSSGEKTSDPGTTTPIVTVGLAVAQPNLVPVGLPVPMLALAAPADIPTMAPVPSHAPAPLAIAAAAIATSSATVAAGSDVVAEPTSSPTSPAPTVESPHAFSSAIAATSAISPQADNTAAGPLDVAPVKTPETKAAVTPLAPQPTEKPVTAAVDPVLSTPSIPAEPIDLKPARTNAALVKSAPVKATTTTLSSPQDTAPDDGQTTAATSGAAQTNVVPHVSSSPGIGEAPVTDAGRDTFATAPAPTGIPVHPHAAAGDTAPALNNSIDTTSATPATIQLSQTTTTFSPTTAAVHTATNVPVPISGLAVEIVATARSGKSRFEIRLDPAELGRIDVRIDVDRNGQVTSHLTVEKPETLAILRQDAPQLQQALNDAGLKTNSDGLQFSLRDQSSGSGQNGGNDTSRQAQRLVIAEDDTVPATLAGRSYGRALGSSGGVDIRV